MFDSYQWIDGDYWVETGLFIQKNLHRGFVHTVQTDATEKIEAFDDGIVVRRQAFGSLVMSLMRCQFLQQGRF